MIRTRLAAVAAGICIAFTATSAAHAIVTPVQVKIYLENNNHNPGTVTADCGPAGAVLHTALFNDAVGANVIETAVVYAEPANPTSGLGTIVFGPVDVPIGGHVNVSLPYQAGVAFDAVAVAKGDPLPTTIPDLVARLTAKPPTADNSQLFPSGSAADPKCPPIVPNPCESKPAGIDLKVAPSCPPCPEPDVKNDAAAIVVHPTCVPTTKPSSEPSKTPSSSKPSSSAPTSSSPSATVSTAPATTASPTGTSAGPLPSPSLTPTTAPATTGLAHTGASVLPAALGAFALLAAGTGIVLYARRTRRSH